MEPDEQGRAGEHTATREPLPGWSKMARPYRAWTHEMTVRPFTLEAGPGVWRIGDATQLIEAGVTTPADLCTAQLAAEDAARALVMGQVSALGGAVVWPDSGKAEG